MGSVLVLAAMAAASGTGDGRYPSSEPWCWLRIAASAPWLSAQAHMSMVAAYRSARAVASCVADRWEKRIVNTRDA